MANAGARVDLIGDWKKLEKFLDKRKLKTMINRKFARAQRVCAEDIRRSIVRRINKGIRPKLSGFTRDAKRSRGARRPGLPLVLSGNMRDSIEVKRVGINEFHTGIFAKGRKGKELVKIARIHEGNGRQRQARIPIKVTKRMRRFFLAKFIDGTFPSPLAPDTRIIFLPRRPFMGPGFRDARKRCIKRMNKAGTAVVKELTK